MKKVMFFVVALATCVSFGELLDNARFRVQIINELDGAPLNNMKIVGSFTERYPRWKDAVVDNDFKGTSDKVGRYDAIGKTNVGEAGFRVSGNEGYYDTPWIRVPYNAKQGALSFPRWWQPDDLVMTVSLQRVEHPIPLFVKRVELRNFKRGIGGFDGTNSVLRFDFKKGDWLPPYGQGELADMQIISTLCINGREKFRSEPGKFDWLNFFDLKSQCLLLDDNRISSATVPQNSGIKIRNVSEEPVRSSIMRILGQRQAHERNGKDWYCERFNDYDPNRCYTFRIRSRRDDKGKLVEAYYGKIYGDFEFEGDDKKGLIGVKFLYYLNPTSLDRNLEWDKKNNLCPTAGKHESQQP